MDKFKEEIKRVAKNFKAENPAEVILLHHNDTDGLTSGAILFQAFSRLGIKIKRFSLEKPYPEVLSHILDQVCTEKSVLVLADFGSGMLPMLSTLNVKRHKIYVLDHHKIEPVNDKNIVLLNGLSHGLTSHQFSASALCYFFALALDFKNSDLSWLGALGALGDRFLVDSKLVGLNAEAWEKTVEQDKGEKGSGYIFKLGQRIDSQKLIEALDAMGGVGYLRNGTESAISALCGSIDENFFFVASQFISEMKEKFADYAATFKPIQSEHIEWFDLKDSFYPMGVKSVGLLCGALIDSGKTDPRKYLAGFQRVPNSIPGLGTFEFNQSKVSMRVADPLKETILTGKAKSITDILFPATKAVGGFVDASHPIAGATTVMVGKEAVLIEELERALEL